MLLHIDCTNGISGDALVAALLDASGARPGSRGPLDKVVRPALKAAGIDPRLATVEAVRRDGVPALVFRVAPAPGFAGLDQLIMSMYASAADQPHADAVAAVAERLRAAESAVRDEGEERVHELSGVDTAVELIATAALLQAMAPERVTASPPVLGAGTVSTAHGPAAVPRPLVLQLLHGLPADDTETDDEEPPGELTTPVGAALLAQFADEIGDMPEGAVSRIGCGTGSHAAGGRPSVLRVVLVEAEEAETAAPADAFGDDEAVAGGAGAGSAAAEGEAGPLSGAPALSVAGRPAVAGCFPETEHVVLETNIDDMSAELLAHAAEALREAGALDVWMTPALMKKGRPGTVLHVLAASGDRERLAAAVFAETSTFGLRVLPVERMYAEERRESVRVAGHDIAVRLAFAQGRLATVSPEYEDCRRAAAELGRPVRVVYEAAQALARSRFSAS